MSKPVKEIVKAIYVMISSDELEFVTLCSKDKINHELTSLRLQNPTSKYVTKTYCEIEPEVEYFKFNVFINLDDTIDIVPTPCCQDEETFIVRHIIKENKFVITLVAYTEDEAIEKIHELWCLIYSKKYCKNV